jgi:hypothetical protein
MIPAAKGALEAKEIPRQRGSATRKTTNPAGISLARLEGLKSDSEVIQNFRWDKVSGLGNAQRFSCYMGL